MLDEKDRQKKLDEYLAGIRKTIAESSAMLSQVELRMAETDRLLANQGLTREQVMGMRFSEEQREAVNAELVRRGMRPLEDVVSPTESPAVPPDCGDRRSVGERQARFGMMMKPFRI